MNAVRQQKLQRAPSPFIRAAHFFLATFGRGSMVGLILAATGFARATDYTQLGSYQVGNRTLSVNRTAGGSGSFDAQVYYPATSTGASTPWDTSGGPYPVVVFAHGLGTAPIEEHSLTATHLASYGYLVVMPLSYTSVLDFLATSSLGQDMQSSYNRLVAQNSNSSSFYFGNVDTTGYTAMGHSMGGAASVSIASQSNDVKTVIGWATQNMQVPNITSQLPNVDVPMQQIAGTQDGVVSQSTTTSIYNNAHEPVALNRLIGGFHFGFMDVGSSGLADSGSMPRATQLGYSRSISVQWLDLYIKGDQSVWRDLWGPEAADDPNIATSLRPGISVTTGQPSAGGLPGETVQFSIDIHNTGDFAASYSLFVEDNDWSIDFSSLQTPVLQPGQFTTLFADVHIPITATPGAIDQFLLSARNNTDNGTRGYTYMQATAVPEAGSLTLAGAAGAVALLAARRRFRRR